METDISGAQDFMQIRQDKMQRKSIQEYIANQLQTDLEYDQMTLKEYIDPFTGEPVKRNKQGEARKGFVGK